ncbi:MAG: hypothetical protein QOI22_1311 [Verrucomicrobiota bacterium]
MLGGHKYQLLMKLNAPHKIMFLLSVIVAALGVASHYQKIQFVTLHQFGFLVVGYVLLVLACFIPGRTT